MLISLYIHIPFCRSKCSYCDFYSIVGKKELIKAYLKGLEKELKNYYGRYKLKTVYIGGGTPSILEIEDLKFLFKAIRENFEIEKNYEVEITIEANPESLREDFIIELKNLGVNRLSLGVQTFNDRALKLAGRIADAKIIEDKIRLIKKLNFENWSADLIYGLPFQNLKVFENDLERIIDYGPKHISVYNLTIEKGTPFYKIYVKESSIFPSEEECVEMYKLANYKLEKAGFIRYEISNFSKEGYECRHNLTYWNYEDYIGAGASAVSSIKNKRYKNFADVEKYIKFINKNKLPISYIEKLSPKKRIKEFIMLKLRLSKGLNLLELKEKFNFDLLKERKDIIEKFIKLKYLNFEKNYLSLTLDGILISNSIISEIM